MITSTELTLADIMSRVVRHVLPECSLGDAARQMNEAHISSLLVMSGNTPLGILTERDLLHLLSTHTALSTPVSGIMSAPVLTAKPELGFTAAYAQLLGHHVRHLVVVDEQDAVIGLASETDFRNHLDSGLLRQLHDLNSVMDKELQQLSPDATLNQALALMLRDSASFVLIVENARPVGILTERDMAGLLVNAASIEAVSLRAVMHAPVLTVSRQMPVYEMAGLMQARQLRHLVVVDDDGLVMGMVTLHRLMERIATSVISEQNLRTNLVKIQDLTRLYSALSQCNQAIIRSTSEAELFAKICHIAVQFGGLKMAWIGLLDAASGQILPVAFDGVGVEYLQVKQISVDENSPYGRGPTGTAVREDRPFWCQDFQHDPSTETWHEQGKHFGWGASASLPLHRNGVAIGAFTLYSFESNFFDEASRNLLLEMVLDINFALDNFEREAARRRLEMQSENERTVLELLAKGEPLPTLLNHLAVSYETMYPGMYCSVLLLSPDGLHLRHSAAPSLPAAYCKAIDGALISANAGSFGTAAHARKITIVSDIANDPLWQDYKELAQAHSLAACWSVPIISTQGQLLGMFTLYYSATRSPLPAELAALERGAHLASLAIERVQTETWLNKLSQAVEQSPNTIVITDLAANIEYANAAFTQSTGYSLSEVIGKNPRILHSGKTLKEVYSSMWEELTAGRMWTGELTNCRKNGTEYIESVRIAPMRQADGRVTNYLAIKENITEQKLAEARIQQLAHFDLLTGLPNQVLLKDRVGLSMQIAQRTATQLAVLFLDIDHFKNINDTLGHRVGDELLIQLAARLKSMVREEDTLSRMGGDEFVLVLPGTNADGAARVAEKLLETVAQTYHIEQHELVVTPSIGIAMYPSDGLDFDKLYQCADVAMYRAKQGGRNSFRFFTSEMQARSARRLQLENALRHALALNQLELHYQPQIAMQDGHVVGAEALLRWQHPELGAISPAEFIPIAEESGLILSIGEWVLRTAAKQAKCWMDSGMPAMTIAVNLSAVQFRQANLSELVMQILGEVNLPPDHIELELTESVAMDNPLAAIAVMNELHAHGIRMSIDDFGTGYSSLSYLRKFKVGKLKIDQSFVRDLTDDAESRAIITAIITLATSMGFQTIAEGVETADQLSFLRLQGCNEVQGYYFSKPLAVAQFEEFIRAQNKNL
jgi:diguanylate cyclase (GGDEF)-like protein/PAS domain S-box-containing protein